MTDNRHSITLLVGDCNESLSWHAQMHDHHAYLLDRSNFQTFLDTTSRTLMQSITVYTSLADLPEITPDRCVFYEILKTATEIYYYPSKKWSDHQDEFNPCSGQILTEYFLYLTSLNNQNVHGLNLTKYSDTPYLNLLDSKCNKSTRLWVAGCSVSAGEGVEQNQKYPELVAKKFFGEYVDLTFRGSSLEFQADQILRSDIQSGDIVVWGLTHEYRAVYWNRQENRPRSLNAYHVSNFRKTHQADDPTDETRLYKATIVIGQVSNFCQKIGATLIMIPIMCSEWLQMHLHDHNDYYQLPYNTQFVDRGTDNNHPGPKQHAIYADHVSKIIERILIQ